MKKLLLLLTFLMVSCVGEQTANNTSSDEASNISRSGFDEAEEQAIDLAFISSSSSFSNLGASGNAFGKSLSAAVVSKLRAHLALILQGPCSVDTVNMIEDLLDKIDIVKLKLKDMLQQAASADEADEIQKALDHLDILVEKLQSKLDDCKNGQSGCSQDFIDQLKDRIATLEERLKELKDKVAQSQGSLDSVQAQKIIIELEEEITQLKDTLAKC